MFLMLLLQMHCHFARAAVGPLQKSKLNTRINIDD